MEFPAREWQTCYTTKEEKAKGKTIFDIKILTARNDASEAEYSLVRKARSESFSFVI
jgi:hypothetical protein